jgi:hypothetical protein
MEISVFIISASLFYFGVRKRQLQHSILNLMSISIAKIRKNTESRRKTDSRYRDGSFSIRIWVTLFETLENPPFPPFERGIDKFPPFERGIKGDLKTSIIEFVTIIVNHAKIYYTKCRMVIS